MGFKLLWDNCSMNPAKVYIVVYHWYDKLLYMI